MQGAIGFLDSGSGGLSILQKVKQLLPKYDYIYLGDHAHAPYGNKSFEEIYTNTLKCVSYLARERCPLIIIACNTSSAKALRNIQQLWLPTQKSVVRVLGIIIPTAEEIIHKTKTKHIGVLATQATVASDTFAIEIKKLDSSMHVFQQACPTWVDLVEKKHLYQESTIHMEIKKYITCLLAQSSSMDTIVLGCTHYPLLWQYIRCYIPKYINVVAQGNLVAEKIKLYLNAHREIEKLCTNNNSTKYLTTGDPQLFEKSSAFFLGDIVEAEQVLLA